MENQDTINEIQFILKKLRPYLLSDGGDVEFVKFEDGIVYVRMLGACSGCAQSEDTIKGVIEEALLEEVFEVTGVEEIK